MHEDASCEDFVQAYCQEKSRPRPHWVVTSPPYKGAIKYARVALSLCQTGVALKLPLSFLEPCGDRVEWLSTNAPAICIFLRRKADYDISNIRVGEFWGVWYKNGEGGTDTPRVTTRIVFSS